MGGSTTARERFVTEQPPYSILVRGIETGRVADVPEVRDGRAAVEPPGRRMALRSLRRRQGEHQPALGDGARTLRHGLPGNQRKLDAVTALNEVAQNAGLTLIELALGFVLEHPAITSPIIGPRTMEHLESQLPALELRLESDVLDRIDEIVPPGIDLNVTDVGWVPAAIADPCARAAAPAERSAGHAASAARPAVPLPASCRGMTWCFGTGYAGWSPEASRMSSCSAPLRHDVGREILRGRGQ